MTSGGKEEGSRRKRRRKPSEKKKRRKKKGKIKLPHSVSGEGEFHLPFGHLRFGHLLLNFFEVNVLGGGAATIVGVVSASGIV